MPDDVPPPSKTVCLTPSALLFTHTIHTTGNVGFVTLTQHDEDSGIGYELRATFQITHKDTDGDFVVTITDHRDW